MKLSHVSLLLVVLTACEEEPLAPDLRRPAVPGPDAPVVISGRVVSSGSDIGIEGALLRVTEANAFARADETGHYRLVLPASFRDRAVAVTVLSIGFNARKEIVRPGSGTATFELVMVGNNCLGLVIVTQDGVQEAPEAESAATRRTAVPGNRKILAAR
jgi:hypothetical protein